MIKHVNLYSTDGCHLCEQALALLSATHPNIEVTVLDIMDDPKWLEDFQIRIPVLESNPPNNFKSNSKQQLDWPFDQNQLSDFLAKNA